MPQQTQQAVVDSIRMEPLGKFAQNGVVAGQGKCLHVSAFNVSIFSYTFLIIPEKYIMVIVKCETLSTF